MKFPDNLLNFIERYRLMTVFLSVFLFLQPFSRLSGIRNTAFILLVIAFLLRVYKGNTRIYLKDSSVLAFGILVALSLISSLFGPYRMESLDFIRKNLFYQFIVFFVIISEYKSLEDLKPVLYSVFFGFAVLTIIIIAKTDPSDLLNWLKQTENGNKLLRGYSLFATFYIPITIAYVFCSKGGPAVKVSLTFFIIAETVLSVLNNHRSQVMAILLSAIVITLLAKRYKIILVGLSLSFFIGAAIYSMNSDSFNRYKTLLYAKNYVSNEHEGLNDRLAIWQGTLNMIKDRPILGYGYGWKKLALVARDGGYLDRWDKNGRTYYYFNTAGYGQANMHNLVLQILFEIGILGLGAFLFFWITILKKTLSCFGKDSVAANFCKYSIGIIISYTIINMANGLWEEAYGILIISFAAFCIVTHRECTSNRDVQGGILSIKSA